MLCLQATGVHRKSDRRCMAQAVSAQKSETPRSGEIVPIAIEPVSVRMHDRCIVDPACSAVDLSFSVSEMEAYANAGSTDCYSESRREARHPRSSSE